ncbi:hypothetical protein ABBQ38_003149 [Trebouxia sp. C0009 RCD-2024]
MADEDAASLLRTFAACIVQAHVRGFQHRRQFLRQKDAVRCIQRCWRHHSFHLRYINRAASKVQAAWRNRGRHKLYLFYRDLIRFREGCPPVDLLKCINPREASIIDAFSGVHLRFRFGGSSFPPTVLYKIFTHAAVTDICSFCPRDYAAQGACASGPQGLLDRKAQPPAVPYDMTGWYRRWENNGWRPIADRLFVDPEAAVKQEKADACQYWFHFCPKVRRQQRQAAAKQRKRLWMSKVYREGMVQAEGQNQESQASEYDIALHEEPDAEAELLQWSGGLDFDDYTRSWSTLASSTVSELACPSEPYEAGPGSQTWAVNTIAANYNLSVPFKAAATAAAGSTPGLLHCYA